MPSPRSQPKTATSYWQKRVRSASFQRRFRALVAQELETLARTPIEDVIDPASIHRVIDHFDIAAVDIEVIERAVHSVRQQAAAALKARPESLRQLLGPRVTAEMEATDDDNADLPPYAGDIMRGIIEQEFVRRLLTDLIFTAIDGFYRKLNPLFGAMTTRMLEDQIKGFIRLFMPTLQQQAVLFATSTANQKAAADIGRSLVRSLLDEPVARLGKAMATGDVDRLIRLLRQREHAPRLDSLARQVARTVFDDMYKHVRRTKVGELVAVDGMADWLGDQMLTALGGLTAHDSVIEFITDEIAEMATAAAKPRGKKG